MDDKTSPYGKSSQSNFWIEGDIGVPHPYCITAGHVAFASDHHSGMLGEFAIEQAEKNGITCGAKDEFGYRCRLPFRQHEKAVLVHCLEEPNKNEELKEYLLSIKDQITKDGYVGFAFVKAN